MTLSSPLLAKGSSGNCYQIEFDCVDGRLFARCGCAAGELNQLCKHLIAFFAGDCSMLFQPDQEPALLESLKTLDGAGILAAFGDLQGRLAELDLELATVKKRIDKERKGRKAEFMRSLGAGYPLP
jgi:uncharacterized Zn finger protein